MKLLALDSSTEACTVALWLDGEVHELFETDNRHSERLLAMIDELLSGAGLPVSRLDAIAFGRGPGSFTGLRIGAGVAQGLAFSAGLPVVPVSTLAALAQGTDGMRILPALDARMQQVYWGAYRRNPDGMVEPVQAEIVTNPDSVFVPDDSGWIGAGSGWDAYAPALENRLGKSVQEWLRGRYPRAGDLAVLAHAALRAGQGGMAEAAIPVYIRDDVAEKRKTGR